jgi:hypothetical protein
MSVRPGRVATTLSFVVLALLVAIFGVLAALNTPADIFPSLNIPVVSVVWTDNGLLPNDMSGPEPVSLAPRARSGSGSSSWATAFGA